MDLLSRVRSGTAAQTVAAESFLNLLLTLRITFLQDSVYMRNLMPTHPVWKHQLFSDPDYLEFKRSLEVAAEVETDDESLLMRRVIPFVERQMVSLNERQQETCERMIELNSNVPTTSIRTLSTDNIGSSETLSSDVSNTTSATTTNITVNNTLVNVPTAPTAQQYKMSRDLTTITDLYREWTEGLGGNYSIEHLNTHFPGWYKNDKTFYMRRRKIISTIERYAEADRMSMIDAVRRAEMLRSRNNKSFPHHLGDKKELLERPRCDTDELKKEKFEVRKKRKVERQEKSALLNPTTATATASTATITTTTTTTSTTSTTATMEED
ncbi:transcriptional activator of glycolytic enzymes-domain-containing protein [Pilaira anomala]|nr:transcriptional activator of glycolytic enzymes-domain-containing protein [Pilaira anomala]